MNNEFKRMKQEGITD